MPDRPDLRVRRAALLAAATASFLTPFQGSAVNVALPSIGADLGMHTIELSWVATAFLLASTVCLVPFGRVADIVGRKKVFLTGMAVFSATALACGLARNGPALIVFRTLQGMGAAMIFSTGLAILTSVYPPGERGRVLGLNASVVYVGLSIGPFVGGLLTQHCGWRGVFLATVPLGIAATGMAAHGLTGEWRSESRGRFDIAGSVIYAVTLVALMTGLSALPSGRGVLLTLAGAVAAGLFFAWERRVASPVFDVKLLASNPVFARSNLAALSNYSATFAVTFLISLYLQYIRGLDPARAGLVLLTQSVMMAAVSPFAGWLSDRLEPRIVASAGMVLTVLGLGWFCFLAHDTPLAVVIGALVVVGAGFGLFSSPNTNAVMSSVASTHYGVASATLGTMRLLGQMVSMGLAAAVLAYFVGHAPITPVLHPRFLDAMHVAFLVSALICTAGVFASLARGKVHRIERR